MSKMLALRGRSGFWAVLFVLWTALAPSSSSALEQGGYVCREENGAVNETWNFIKHFSYDQYYWAVPQVFTSWDSSYVDNMDTAFFSGHGGNFSITTLRNCCDPVDFSSGAVSLGDVDLEFLTIDACSVAPSPIERADWASGWWGVFHRLHQLLSFRTTGWYDGRVEDQYAGNLLAGQKYIDAWFNAANSVRDGMYPGYCAVIWAYPQSGHPGTANDTYYDSGTDPPNPLSVIAITYQY